MGGIVNLEIVRSNQAVVVGASSLAAATNGRTGKMPVLLAIHFGEGWEIARTPRAFTTISFQWHRLMGSLEALLRDYRKSAYEWR